MLTTSSMLLALVLWLGMAGGASAAQFIPGVPMAGAPQAQSAPPIADPDSRDVELLVRLLADPRMVEWTRKQADAHGRTESDSSAGGVTPQEWLNERLSTVGGNAAAIASAWRASVAQVAGFRDGWKAEMTEGETLRSMIYVIVFLVIGAGVEWLYWRYASSVRRRIENEAREGGQIAVRTTLRALLAGFGIGLFATGTLGAFLAFDWADLVKLLVLSLLLAVVAIRVMNTVAVFVLCPRVADLRLIPISTAAAKFMHRWFTAIFTIGIVGALVALALRRMEIASQLHLVMSSASGTVVAVLAVVAFWRWRARRHPSGETQFSRARRRRVAADLTPVLATGLVIIAWALWVIGAHGLMWTLLIIVSLVLADRGIRAVLRAGEGGVRAEPAPEPESEGETGGEQADGGADRGADRGAATDAESETGEATVADPEAETGGATAAAPAPTSRRALYRPVAERFLRIVLFVSAALALGITWGLDVINIMATDTLLGRFFAALVDVLGAYLIADLVWVWTKTAIDARLADYIPPEPGHAPGPDARLATLLPLLRMVLMITLVVMMVLITLSSFGINVGPLVAGAGVMGIAIGFGAQTLVKDIVSGIFFLLDDAFRVGEYIESGDMRGTVESISIRSMRLRHHRGQLHTVPFGEMTSLTNHSRDWVIMKLELRVPFDTDLRLVKKLVKNIGAEMEKDEEYGASFIEPLKSQGVRRMEEFNMVVGVKFMAKPGEQWLIRKDAYQKIRDAFDAHGINFAERNVKVEVLGGDPNSPEVREAAIGAAQQAIEEQLGEPAPGRAAGG